MRGETSHTAPFPGLHLPPSSDLSTVESLIKRGRGEESQMERERWWQTDRWGMRGSLRPSSSTSTAPAASTYTHTHKHTHTVVEWREAVRVCMYLSVVEVQESSPDSGWSVLVSSLSILEGTELIFTKNLQNCKPPAHMMAGSQHVLIRDNTHWAN